MLQQRQDNMLQDEEVVHFGQRVQQLQDQQQLQLQQHNISHNPVYPKQTSPEFIVWMAGFTHPGCVLSFHFSTPLVPGGISTEQRYLQS